MKKYDEAIDAYNAGLKISPNEEHLKLGLSAAKRAKMDSKPAARAARKSVATQRASRSKSMRVKKAPTVSAFVQQTRLELKLQMLAIQAQLDLIEQLAAMTDDEKLDLLFTLVDVSQPRFGSSSATYFAHLTFFYFVKYVARWRRQD